MDEHLPSGVGELPRGHAVHRARLAWEKARERLGQRGLHVAAPARVVLEHHQRTRAQGLPYIMFQLNFDLFDPETT